MTSINLRVTSGTLCELLEGKFSYEGCEAVCAYLEEMSCNENLRLGDIIVRYAEVPANWEDEYNEEDIIAHLKNGNIIVAQ